MHLATPVSTSAAPHEVILRRGEVPQPPDASVAAINDPAPRFSRVYANDIFGMLGVGSISYSKGDEIKIRFMHEDLARLANSVLRDNVLGAKLIMADLEGNPYKFADVGPIWTYHPSNMAKDVALLPGVTGYKYIGKSLFFTVASQDVRVKMQQLVEPTFDNQWSTLWQGQCWGNGCPVYPPAPDGRVPELPTKPKPTPGF